jgi:hypothetical protein
MHTEAHMPDMVFAPPLAQETKIVLYRSADPPERHPNIEITYSVVIRHPEPTLQSQPPVPLLNTISGIVQSLLMATEAECRQLGLVG